MPNTATMVRTVLTATPGLEVPVRSVGPVCEAATLVGLETGQHEPLLHANTLGVFSVFTSATGLGSTCGGDVYRLPSNDDQHPPRTR